MSRKKEFKNGLRSRQQNQMDLTSNISVAKGLLATLELGHQSLWTKKLARTRPEHLRILLLEVMDEIFQAEMKLT